MAGVRMAFQYSVVELTGVVAGMEEGITAVAEAVAALGEETTVEAAMMVEVVLQTEQHNSSKTKQNSAWPNKAVRAIVSVSVSWAHLQSRSASSSQESRPLVDPASCGDHINLKGLINKAERYSALSAIRPISLLAQL